MWQQLRDELRVPITMDVEAMGLGLAILVACGVALTWLIAFGEEHARRS
jgi:hypothetical protein